MRNSFFEFNVAVSGLMTARAGLNVTSHNTANASTPGYSRQYVDMKASTPITFFDGRGMVGTGSEVTGVKQIRSFYLDTKYWRQSSTLGEYSSKYQELNLIESVLNELSGMGLSGSFDNFFTTLSDLSTTAGDATYRSSVLQAASTLTGFVQSTVSALQQQQKEINTAVGAMVKQINSLGAQIASLNKEIHLYEADGSNANDLRDQRALLIDELSKYVNVEVEELDYSKEKDGSDMRFSILVNGYDFVSHHSYNAMRVEKREEKVNPTDAADLYDVYIGPGKLKFDIYSPNLTGELKGLVDVRDGNNNGYFTGTIDVANSNGRTIVVNPPFPRTDLLQSGELTLTDANGKVRQYTYDSFTFNKDGTVTLTLNTKDKVEDFLDTNSDSVSDYQISIGKTNEFKGIPYYLDKINNLVRTFAKAMNEGLDRDGKPIPGMTGHVNGVDGYPDEADTNYLFFSYSGKVSVSGLTPPDPDDPDYGDLYREYQNNLTNFYNNFNAFNFQVNSEILANPMRMNCNTNDAAGESENKVIMGFVDLKDYISLFKEGKLADYVIGMSGQLGIDIRHSEQFTESYSDITLMIDNQRLQVSGVSLNEEMISLVKYNQLYQACAKLLNIIDGIYDTTINRLGLT